MPYLSLKTVFLEDQLKLILFRMGPSPVGLVLVEKETWMHSQTCTGKKTGRRHHIQTEGCLEGLGQTCPHCPQKVPPCPDPWVPDFHSPDCETGSLCDLKSSRLWCFHYGSPRAPRHALFQMWSPISSPLSGARLSNSFLLKTVKSTWRRVTCKAEPWKALPLPPCSLPRGGPPEAASLRLWRGLRCSPHSQHHVCKPSEKRSLLPQSSLLMRKPMSQSQPRKRP